MSVRRVRATFVAPTTKPPPRRSRQQQPRSLKAPQKPRKDAIADQRDRAIHQPVYERYLSNFGITREQYDQLSVAEKKVLQRKLRRGY